MENLINNLLEELKSNTNSTSILSEFAKNFNVNNLPEEFVLLYVYNFKRKDNDHYLINDKNLVTTHSLGSFIAAIVYRHFKTL